MAQTATLHMGMHVLDLRHWLREHDITQDGLHRAEYSGYWYDRNTRGK